MKIAVLILAHGYPPGVAALARYFPPESFDLFVHVDAKVDIQPFRTPAAARAVFLEDRINVFWRGWTIVEAELKLFHAARRRARYDSFVLLSDDSVPIVRPPLLLDRLREQPNIIEVENHQIRRARYDQFFMFDSKATQLRPTDDRAITEDAIERFGRLVALWRRGKKPLDVFYDGSQWMALSADAVDHLLATWDADPWLRQSFEFSDAPDESYIQTVIGSWGRCRSAKLMHVDWSVPVPPRVYRSAAELAAITPRGEMFARKVNFEPHELETWITRVVAGEEVVGRG